MDFDLSKENIQPLRGGRNVVQLGMALQAQNNEDYQRELLQERQRFEHLIKTYTGDDPLENWYNYVYWVEQTCLHNGHEGGIKELLQRCLKLFEHDEKYYNDRRMVKLWIKFIDLHPRPLELYKMLYSVGIGIGCADLYKAWAYYHELAGNFQEANKIFESGRRNLAQPYEELENAHKNLVMSAGQTMILGPNHENLQENLWEKRQALMSLLTYKGGQVGSVRMHHNNGLPGILPAGPSQQGPSNAKVQCYEDNDENHKVVDPGAPPLSILTACMMQDMPKENTLKPGPWTTMPVKKKLATPKVVPFTVHEDSDDDVQIIEPEEKPSGSTDHKTFASESKEDFTTWITRLTLPEVYDERAMPMYPKQKVYKELGTEYALEEIRAERYSASIRDQFSITSVETVNANQAVLERQGSPMDQSKPSEQNNSIYNSGNPPVVASVILDDDDDDDDVIVISNQPEPVPANSWGQEVQNHQNPNISNFDIWNTSNNHDDSEVSMVEPPRNAVTKFSIYEQSNMGVDDEPRGKGAKTPFKDLNSEGLAESGSGKASLAAGTRQSDSGHKRPPLMFDDDSSSSSSPFGKMRMDVGGGVGGSGGGGSSSSNNLGDISCNTQMFNFNLNVMQVSTPQNKNVMLNTGTSPKSTRKQLFTETESFKPDAERTENKEHLSVIFEETKSYRSSSSSGAMTKSSICSNNTQRQPSTIATISEEHNSYLAQNLKANAALRSSLLGEFINFDTSEQSSTPETPPTFVRAIPQPTAVSPIDFVPSDPFRPAIINQLLQRVNFPGPHTAGYTVLNSIPKLTVRKETITVGTSKYLIEKHLGKGTYGTVFKGCEFGTGETVALKLQKPANRWEFYICRELQSRLAEHPLRERFMDVRIGYFCDLSSLYISEFMPCGSLLDVANTLKQKSGRTMKESLCIYFCLEMLRVVKAMHDVKIIHADIKPDNFLVRPTSNGNIHLQLIDFGCSIDMTLFPPNAYFTRRITTEDFVCCEMLDGRPWNYHTDLFCVAATAHVLLFDKYIQMQKKDGHWSISQKIQRYMRVDLWNMFFSSLLNQQDGPANTMTLETMLDDSLKLKPDDFNIEMRSLLNILRNR